MTREEAIKKLKEQMSHFWKDTRDALTELIPELRESEDEKNWKAALEYIKDDALRAWLESKKKSPGVYSREAIKTALTFELTKRIRPLHEKSLNHTITSREDAVLGALVELRSFVNSPNFKIGEPWDEEDEKKYEQIRQAISKNNNSGDLTNWLSCRLFNPSPKITKEQKTALWNAIGFIRHRLANHWLDGKPEGSINGMDYRDMLTLLEAIYSEIKDE